MNKIILIGRLTRDPELKYINSGKAVANFTLAVDRPYTSKDGEKETDFIICQAWGSTAENLANYMTKGRQVAVDGRLQVRSYEKDGKRQWISEVVADRVEFLGAKNDGQGPASPLDKIGEEVVFSDEDIPF